jgi:cytochrome bd-type quinol oxidase subunit 2
MMGIDQHSGEKSSYNRGEYSDTLLGGVVALVALAIHGALYLAVKTESALQQRARAFARAASAFWQCSPW